MAEKQKDQDEVGERRDLALLFVAERADIWRTAYAVMRDVGLTDPAPEDVLELAIFLAGDNINDD